MTWPSHQPRVKPPPGLSCRGPRGEAHGGGLLVGGGAVRAVLTPAGECGLRKLEAVSLCLFGLLQVGFALVSLQL